jgi:hypothetical protein
MTHVEVYPVAGVAGLPETRLPDDLLARLPASVAPAPWLAHCEVVSWMHPIDASAIADAVGPAVAPDASYVAWALVRYHSTPVGPYSEVAATLLPAEADGYGHIPFIVVDSLPSIVGGRANWLLPKALARFTWSDDGLAVGVTPEQPARPAWNMRIAVTVTGDPASMTLPNHVQQATTDGAIHRFEGALTGDVASATVEVHSHADGPLAALLRPGRYDASIVTNAVFDVGALHA